MPRPALTLVVSDLHLCGTVPDGQTWLGYRQRRFGFDAALAALLDAAADHAREARAALAVVLNGDAFDLDAPDVRRWPPPPAELGTRSDAATADLLGAVLDDHPAVVAALARAARGGAQLVFVAGNHDAYLALPQTAAALRDRLAAAAGAGAPRAEVRRLFYRAAGGLHVEHGHQYDPGCALASPLAPQRPTLGSVATRCLPAALGCLNPYGVDPLAIGAGELARAFLACARADARHVPAQLAAAVAALRQLATTGGAGADPALLAALAAETGADRAALRAHLALAATPAGFDWLAAPRAEAYGAEVARRQREAARAIARAHGAAAVVMGHTHDAAGATEGGVFYGNTGTWAPSLGRAAGDPIGHYAWAVAAGGAPARVAVHPCVAAGAP